MKISDRVQTHNVKGFPTYSNRPSVAMRLVDTRASNKSGLVIERADAPGWWIVLHDSPVGQGAVYHESELTVIEPPKVEYQTPPEQFHRPSKR